MKVAVSQHEPEWLDLQKSVEKACRIIDEAADNGAKLVAFPEAFIPGYPAWIWTRLVDPVMTGKYIKNSLVVESEEMETIKACAKRRSIVVSLGFSENDSHSLYIAQALIDSNGQLLMNRRKVKATHMERTIFGDASGDSLMNVKPTSAGVRVGSLACWEHTQPLLKYHTIHQKEEIHCAAWPPLATFGGGGELWGMSKEVEHSFESHRPVSNTPMLICLIGCQSLSQSYAIESQAFVLHSTTVITEKGIEAMRTSEGALMARPGGGFSAVFGPDGRMLTEPIDQATEGLVYADLDMDNIIYARSFLDVCGHYSRPDLLWLGCDTRQRSHKIDT